MKNPSDKQKRDIERREKSKLKLLAYSVYVQCMAPTVYTVCKYKGFVNNSSPALCAGGGGSFR